MSDARSSTAGVDVLALLGKLESLPVERRRAAIAMLDERGADFHVFPLSSAQTRLWLSCRLHGDTPLYNVSLGYRMKGDLDTRVLSRALQVLVQRHEMLRTQFFEVDGRPYQAIRPELTLPLKVGRLPERGEEREALVARLLDVESSWTFDLRRVPLQRAVLLTAPEDGDHLLVLTTHHIIYDGWSSSIYLRELGEVYSAILDGRPPALRPLPTRYVDFARWQARRMATSTVGDQLRYWVDRLRDAPPLLQLPGDRPRPAFQRHRGHLEEVLWPPAERQSLETFCRRERTTTFVVLLAALAALVHRSTGREDVIVAAPFANRDRPEVEEVVGFFVNTLVLRLRVPGGIAFRELLGHVREVTIAAQGNQDVPFEMVVDAVKSERSTSYHPLFQLIFAVQDRDSMALRLRGVESRLVLGHNGTSKFDVTLTYVPVDDGLLGSLEYDSDQFERARMRRLLADMRAIVLAAVADPEVSLAALPIGG